MLKYGISLLQKLITVVAFIPFIKKLNVFNRQWKYLFINILMTDYYFI